MGMSERNSVQLKRLIEKLDCNTALEEKRQIYAYVKRDIVELS